MSVVAAHRRRILTELAAYTYGIARARLEHEHRPHLDWCDTEGCPREQVIDGMCVPCRRDTPRKAAA